MKIAKFLVFVSVVAACASTPARPDTETGSKPVGMLHADGDDAKTYDLIVSSGYNYETPDRSGNHAQQPFRHITQSYDSFLKKPVFDFWLHVENDDDRGKANIKDRQRNEIKTDAKSPESMVAQKGETLKITWKFMLPEGMQTTTKFSHVHQLKGIDNKDGNADVSSPLITFTCRSLSKGGQQFQIIYTAPSSTGKGTTYLHKSELSEALGEWLEVEEIVRFDKSGSYSVIIKRMRDSKVIAKLDNVSLDLWRSGSTGMRPKWGLYRWFGTNRSDAYLLRDECLKFADFNIQKL
jgi:hypothetical protein